MTSIKQLHNTQLDIITKLCERYPLRFTELQTKEIPNNVFSYHLKKLLEMGYIVQNDSSAYEPTRKARKILSYVDESTRRTSAPKPLTMLLIKDTTGKFLLLRRSTQPFLNWYGLPSGMVHFGERIEDAARRELAEKTGIRSSRPLSFLGVLDFQYLQADSNDIFVHANAFVYSHLLKDRTLVNLPSDTYLWSSLDHDSILPEVNAVKIIDSSVNRGVTSMSFIEPQNIHPNNTNC